MVMMVMMMIGAMIVMIIVVRRMGMRMDSIDPFAVMQTLRLARA